MTTKVDDELGTRETELQLKGLIYVRALRAAAGASNEELRQFSDEIGRQRRRLEKRGYAAISSAASPAAAVWRSTPVTEM